MAEISKLSVGKVLEKIRSSDEPKKTQAMQREEKMATVDEEIQRLRAARARLKRPVNCNK